VFPYFNPFIISFPLLNHSAPHHPSLNLIKGSSNISIGKHFALQSDQGADLAPDVSNSTKSLFKVSITAMPNLICFVVLLALIGIASGKGYEAATDASTFDLHFQSHSAQHLLRRSTYSSKFGDGNDFGSPLKYVADTGYIAKVTFGKDVYDLVRIKVACPFTLVSTRYKGFLALLLFRCGCGCLDTPPCRSIVWLQL
jgi:hypothetical protein